VEQHVREFEEVIEAASPEARTPETRTPAHRTSRARFHVLLMPKLPCVYDLAATAFEVREQRRNVILEQRRQAANAAATQDTVAAGDSGTAGRPASVRRVQKLPRYRELRRLLNLPSLKLSLAPKMVKANSKAALLVPAIVTERGSVRGSHARMLCALGRLRENTHFAATSFVLCVPPSSPQSTVPPLSAPADLTRGHMLLADDGSTAETSAVGTATASAALSPVPGTGSAPQSAAVVASPALTEDGATTPGTPSTKEKKVRKSATTTPDGTRKIKKTAIKTKKKKSADATTPSVETPSSATTTESPAVTSPSLASAAALSPAAAVTSASVESPAVASPPPAEPAPEPEKVVLAAEAQPAPAEAQPALAEAQAAPASPATTQTPVSPALAKGRRLFAKSVQDVVFPSSESVEVIVPLTKSGVAAPDGATTRGKRPSVTVIAPAALPNAFVHAAVHESRRRSVTNFLSKPYGDEGHTFG